MKKADLRSTPCEKFHKNILIFDQYRTPFRFIMPGDTD